MFTGIIEELGIIKTVKPGRSSSQLTIGARKVLEDAKIGDSINTDGVCLTVTGIDHEGFTVDVMPETMKRSTLGNLKSGMKVNLERALRLSDRLGGHLVSGHIDDTGSILKKWTDENAVWLTISTDKKLFRYLAGKGSVAIDGISLTIAKVEKTSFDVSIIPHTQIATALIQKSAGESVNIECDMIAKYLETLITRTGESGTTISMNYLSEHGFI